jgi:hypothetical protein
MFQGIAKGYESDVPDTILCLNALVTDGKTEAFVLQKSVSYIIREQNADGSWSFSRRKNSTVSLTAQTAITLNLYQTKTNLTFGRLQTSMKKAGEFLVYEQKIDRTWGTDEEAIMDILLSYRAVNRL